MTHIQNELVDLTLEKTGLTVYPHFEGCTHESEWMVINWIKNQDGGNQSVEDR